MPPRRAQRANLPSSFARCASRRTVRLAPAAVARENALTAVELTVGRVGWGLPISGEPTVHLQGLGDTASAYSSPTRQVRLPRVFREYVNRARQGRVDAPCGAPPARASAPSRVAATRESAGASVRIASTSETRDTR